MANENVVKPPSGPRAPFARISEPDGSAAAFERPLYQRAGQRIFEVLARWLCRVWCPVEIAGRHNLPHTPYLICANHASHLDAIAILVATGQPFSRFAILAAHDYFFATPFRRIGFACLLNLIPLDRAASPASAMSAITECRKFLNRDFAAGLILFPEGGRSVTDTVSPFRRGSALFPIRLGLPVVPVSIVGTRRLMPKGRLLARPGRISVQIGEPLSRTDSDSAMVEAWSRIVSMQESQRD